ncbi:MAG: peptidase M48, partial [Sphingomonas sp.]|nr:peptidase M48 [Sphingomonas sp.]
MRPVEGGARRWGVEPKTKLADTRVMKKLVAALALSLLTLAQPAAAQSLLRDAETEAMFDDMARPL